MRIPKIAEIRKALVPLATAVAAAISAGLITGTTAAWVSVGLLVAASLGVYAVRNAQAPTNTG
jgi:hypothetical protein